jgi:glyoxylase-like metal-dependent hydrolase (beta-lactamase superfamily II)
MRKLSLFTTVLLSALSLISISAFAQLPQPDGGTIERGTLPSHWLSQAPKCMEIPDWQVHEYNPNFYLMRQSPCTDFEKPFVFLLFGQDKALLVDTGSRNGNLAPTLEHTVKNWLARNHRPSISLIVVHSHPHEDHVWGDKEVQAMHDPAIQVTLIPAEIEATKRFYGIEHWPDDIGHVDLGGRMIDLIPIPGHSNASVALYDRNTAVLLAGDSLYPGRLYVADFPAFQASTERLIRFTAGKPVAQILGNHIEQTSTPFLDYPVGTMYQPHEHELALSRGSLLELEDALLSMHGKPQRLALRDFSVWPVGAQFISDAEKARFKQHVEQQKEEMWDHAAH